MHDKMITTVSTLLAEDDRDHLTRLCNKLELQEMEARATVTEQNALRKLLNLPAAGATVEAIAPQPGFIPTRAERNILGRIHDAAPPVHIGDLTRRLVRRILAVACPVQCAIRGMCTNKCGELDRGG